jgi:hypothetical protein
VERFAHCPFSAAARDRYQRRTRAQMALVREKMAAMIEANGGLPRELAGMSTTCHRQQASEPYRAFRALLERYAAGGVAAEAVIPAACDAADIMLLRQPRRCWLMSRTHAPLRLDIGWQRRGRDRMEGIVDLVVSGEATLCLSGRLEALRLPFSSSCRLVRVVGSVVQALVPEMLDTRHHLPLRRAVAAELVGDHDAGRSALPPRLRQRNKARLGKRFAVTTRRSTPQRDALHISGSLIVRPDDGLNATAKS